MLCLCLPQRVRKPEYQSMAQSIFTQEQVNFTERFPADVWLHYPRFLTCWKSNNVFCWVSLGKFKVCVEKKKNLKKKKKPSHWYWWCSSMLPKTLIPLLWHCEQEANAVCRVYVWSKWLCAEISGPCNRVGLHFIALLPVLVFDEETMSSCLATGSADAVREICKWCIRTKACL